MLESSAACRAFIELLRTSLLGSLSIMVISCLVGLLAAAGCDSGADWLDGSVGARRLTLEWRPVCF